MVLVIWHVVSKILFGSRLVGARSWARERMPRWMLDLVRRRVKGPLGQIALGAPRATALTRNLWGGFSVRAAEELTALESTGSRREATEAAMALAHFHYMHGRYERALEEVRLSLRIEPAQREHVPSVLIESDSLLSLGRAREARELLLLALERAPQCRDFRLALANTYASPTGSPSRDDDERRLSIINDIYKLEGLAELRLREPARGLRLDNLEAALPQSPVVTSGRISVIVPTYNAADTLGTAIEGLVAQSWHDLEILIVDDASSDATCDIAHSWAERDVRIRVLRLSDNRGAYVARNRGLAEASGDFVTVHDADDWSHPQKLELQVRALLQAPEQVRNESMWVRCYQHLYFRSNGLHSNAWVGPNISSLMTKRALLLELGGWDEVRIGADSELARRIDHGTRDSVFRVASSIPLSFSLDDPRSLTKTSATHVRTVHHGVRRTYHDAAKDWLSLQPRGLVRHPGARPFPAPALILSQRHKMELDVVFVFDVVTSMQGWRAEIFQRALEAARESQKIGIFHYPHYGSSVGRSLPRKVHAAAREGLIYVVSAGEQVRTRRVLIADPTVLDTPLDNMPTFEGARVILEIEPSAAPRFSEDVARVEEIFGCAVELTCEKV